VERMMRSRVIRKPVDEEGNVIEDTPKPKGEGTVDSSKKEDTKPTGPMPKQAEDKDEEDDKDGDDLLS